jgi:hypothetical protein
MKATTERKSAYLEEQKRIAAPLIKLGGPSKKLGEERIAEAIRVASLSDTDFEDYIEGWTPIKNTP